MGIFNWPHQLVNWGIDRMDDLEGDIQKVGQRLGFMPLSWRQVAMRDASKSGLLWRIPDPSVAMASSLSRVQAIVVAEYERAMVLKDGVLLEQAVLPPGFYDIRRATKIRGQIEIIWTTTTEFKLPWGVNAFTQDRVRIKASGFYTVAIVAPDIFLSNIVGHDQVVTKDTLNPLIRDDVNDVMKGLIPRKTVMEFQIARNEFIEAAKEELQPVFDRWGLEFRGLTAPHQDIPEEYVRAAEARVKVTMEKEAQIEGAKADVDLAQLESQKRYFLAQAEATKYYVIQDAEVESMRRQLSIGIDPLKLKMAEAMGMFANNPGQGSLIDNRAQIIAQLSTGINTPTNNIPVDILNQVPPSSTPVVGPAWGKEPSGNQPGGIPGSIVVPGGSSPIDQTNPTGLPSFVPPAQQVQQTSAPTSNPPATGDSPMTREKIEEMLDKLDDRFASGEMSEQTYLMLRGKWQKKLDAMA